MNSSARTSLGLPWPGRAPARIAWTVLVLVALLPGGQAGAAVVDPCTSGGDGRSPRDLLMEEFLRTAEVVAIEPVGDGITNPQRLTLRQNGVEHRAIFKTVDLMIRDVVHTNRYETCFRDCYRFEVAAYRLDRMLGIGLVPVTVLREVNGQLGSVQEWIEDVTNLRNAMEHPDQAGRGDEGALFRRLTLMYVFDSLIFNIDRNYDNIIINPIQDRFFLIDHSRAFRTNRKVDAPQQGQGVQTLEPGTVDRMRSLEVNRLSEQLGELLTKAQIRALVKRRDGLLEVLAEGGYLPAVVGGGA